MILHNIKLKDSLNKAYLKLPPTRLQIDAFKTNFKYLVKQVKVTEGEEYHKNEISEFLKKTYYAPNHYINTKGRYDLVIHNGKDSSSSVGVIVEAKSPGNLSEMPTVDNLNAKAIRELILYYLRERITNNNLELKHLITTNLYVWFIFDAHEFEKHFASNKSLVKQFNDFEEGRSSGKDTNFFYNSIAAPYLESLESEIRFTHLDLRNYEKVITNDNSEDDSKLIPLFKILSSEHLLKLQFKNDSNSLDKDFYRELLHIIGLEETKLGGKKLIGRASEKTRNYGSLLESAIAILNIEDCITQIPRPSDYGETKEEQLFNISLELVITWINRVLFLKLLEGQLVRYNQGDKSFRFLERNIIPDYDAVNKLFFSVLAIPVTDRDDRLKAKFSRIPYLNSSLFEPTDLEHKTIRISNLDDVNRLPIHKSTVLKDTQGKRVTGEMPTLIYLFDFLDAYNFSSEGSKGIQEENKTLINASVLGLIFEKINGYKDGSFFTPGFITQYMCQETITRAVIQKFNEVKGWNCASLVDVNNKIEDKEEANKIINSLRICDPAVGSGHFLVSALNEVISIKSDLKILMDQKGRVLRDYHFEVINDELIVSDPEGELFEYNPKNQENHRVQEAIFHEKQTIIENCLFGVDINPNSVKICRLRLWIELLKHAYYKSGTQIPELETLPNIDINIKCGNSIISKYSLDADIKTALKSSKWTVDNYREAVMTYRNSETKEQKRAMEVLISVIKSSFEIEISKKDKRFLRLNRINGELLSLTKQQGLFELDKHQKEEWNKKLKKLTEEQSTLQGQLDEIKNNRIFQNSLEWRFEFPEVLDNEGFFVGFDVLIGNPPYISAWDMFSKDELQRTIIKNICDPNSIVLKGHWDLYIAFILRAIMLAKNRAIISFIVPNPFLREKYASQIRKHLLTSMDLKSITLFEDNNVFDDVARRTIILDFENTPQPNNAITLRTVNPISRSIHDINYINKSFWLSSTDSRFNIRSNDLIENILRKIEAFSIKLGTTCYINYGAQVSSKIQGGFSKTEVVSKLPKGNPRRFIEGKDIHRWHINYRDLWLDYRADELYGARFKELFENEKILIRKISDRNHKLAASIDKNNYYADDGAVIAVPYYSLQNQFSAQEMFGYSIRYDEIPLEFVLSQLLCSTTTFYFKNRFSTESLQGGTSHTYPMSIRELPICICNEKQKSFISNIVQEIINIKLNDISRNVGLAEAKLNDYIFDLYCFTEEEIRTISENINN